ncbi:Zinc finger protein CONSTANS-LIKE 13 [Hordeum vulgare]|nr:Zinc finger protein CONSTANS-LIKE 13 [Hordeum vulgare]
MAREGREARERLEAKLADEAYMQELCRQHTKLVEAERMIFANTDNELIVISSDDEEIDVYEWRSVFPHDEDDDTGLDQNCGTPYLMRKDRLDLTFDRSSLVKLSLI